MEEQGDVGGALLVLFLDDALGFFGGFEVFADDAKAFPGLLGAEEGLLEVELKVEAGIFLVGVGGIEIGLGGLDGGAGAGAVEDIEFGHDAGGIAVFKVAGEIAIEVEGSEGADGGGVAAAGLAEVLFLELAQEAGGAHFGAVFEGLGFGALGGGGHRGRTGRGE